MNTENIDRIVNRIDQLEKTLETPTVLEELFQKAFAAAFVEFRRMIIDVASDCRQLRKELLEKEPILIFEHDVTPIKPTPIESRSTESTKSQTMPPPPKLPLSEPTRSLGGLREEMLIELERLKKIMRSG